MARKKKWLSYYSVEIEPRVDQVVDLTRIVKQIEREDAEARLTTAKAES